MKITCNAYNDISDYFNIVDRKRFLFIRYEDMANDQQKIARKVYDFLGLEISPSLMNWLKNEKKNGRSKVFKLKILYIYIFLNPHAPARFTPSRTRCAENCGSALTHH